MSGDNAVLKLASVNGLQTVELEKLPEHLRKRIQYALFTKDILEGSKTAPLKSQGFGLPSLPEDDPTDNLGDDISIVYILGKMAILVAKQDTAFRSIMWQQDTQFMQFAVKLGSTLHDSVLTHWNKQADALGEDATMAKNGGLAMFIAGVVGFAGGAVSAWGELKSAGKGLAAKELPAGGLPRSGTGVLEDGAAMSERVGKALSTTDKMGDAAVKTGTAIKHVTGTMTAAEMFASASKSLFVDAPGNTNKKKDTQEGGEADANSKQTECYQNFYNQAHQRGEQTVSGTDQNHGNTLRIYSGAVDAVTNALVSGWNRI